MIDVGVVGWAQTQHGTLERETHQSLIYMVVNEALASCGMSIHDIDVVIDAGSDFLDGRGISTCITVDSMGAHFKEESKIAGDGLLAAIYAYMRIASGLFGTALVVAYGKSSESPPRAQSVSMTDPFYLRPLGLDATAAAALQARAYGHHYGVGNEAAARVAVKNRAAGALNTNAQLRTRVTLEQVMESPELVSPLRELEAAPVTDGACALVMADADVARSLKVRPAWITGSGHAMDPFSPGAREIHKVHSAALAASDAYRHAGVTDPLADLDLLEVTEAFAHQELMLYEAFGLCEEGEGEGLLASGATSPGGRVPVNLSGGALCANPVVATGLVRLAEACARVTDRGEGDRIDGIKRAMAHAAGGLAMQTAACMIVER